MNLFSFLKPKVDGHRVDVRATLTYDPYYDEILLTKSNIKPKDLEEILLEYICFQGDTSRDGLRPNDDLQTYSVTIGFVRSENTFYDEHNCGNNNLATNIVKFYLKRRQGEV